MFSSIKWKFIVVYFLLVFIAMVIVGIFIVGRLEEQQIKRVTNTMEQHLEGITITSSNYLVSEDWSKYREEIQEIVTEWRLDSTETLYVIYNEDVPTILAASASQYEKLIGQNAYKFVDPPLILKAFQGDKAESIIKETNENGDITNKHLAIPVYNGVGQVNGILYMKSDLRDVFSTVNESKTILTNATFLALIITVFLGFLIASSITVPIRDVTKKAEEMAMGDFNQFVEIKSDDEIGQLASMFNHLTLKLKYTIQDMDLERNKLDTIFNYMAEGVVAIGRDGNIILANPIALGILSLTEDNFKQSSLDLKDINLNQVNYDVIETLEGDEVAEINSQFYKVKYAPFRDEKNLMGGLIIVFQDITHEHKLDIMRKEFVANVSHELKTPITTIKSYTETLRDNEVEKEIEKKFLNVIDSECDRMARLVRDLLQLSNLDYKKTNWIKSEISIGEIVKEIVSKLELVIKEKDHEVVLDIQDNIPNIFVDKDGIEQVILNIISNAIKYTEKNGTIKISASKDESNILLKVIDNGIGIPEIDQNRIFERFYRVEKGRSRDLGGTGLGLAIAKEIIEAHNGKLNLVSSTNGGTEMNIVLPIL